MSVYNGLYTFPGDVVSNRSYKESQNMASTGSQGFSMIVLIFFTQDGQQI